jgi:hypothetical protein
MWTWSLNWGEITPSLLIGTCPMTPDDLGLIRRAGGASAVLSLQHDQCLAYWGIDYGALCTHAMSLGLRVCRSPMRDFDIADQRRHLPRAVAALAALQADGHRTYVHCTAGLGRAPLTVLAYLIWIEGMVADEAIQCIHKGRPGAVPAWEVLQGCSGDLGAEHRLTIAERAYALSRLRRPDQGDAQADWLRAEREVIRSILRAEKSLPDPENS